MDKTLHRTIRFRTRPLASWRRASAGRAALLLLGLALALPATAAAPAESKLTRIECAGSPKRDCWLYLPKSYNKSRAYGLVVVLHPAGLNGQHFALVWGDAAERSGDFIVAGPECKDQKKRLWSLADEADLLATVQKIISTYNIDPARVLLTGFSQGSIYTYNFGLRSPQVFRGIAVVSGAIIARPSPVADQIFQRAKGMPVYIVHGALDDRIPVERARASRLRLEQAGFIVTYRELPFLGHAFPEGEADRIWAWFKERITLPVVEQKGPSE